MTSVFNGKFVRVVFSTGMIGVSDGINLLIDLGNLVKKNARANAEIAESRSQLSLPITMHSGFCKGKDIFEECAYRYEVMSAEHSADFTCLIFKIY